MSKTNDEIVVVLPSGMKLVTVSTAPTITRRDGKWWVTGLSGRQPTRGHMFGFFFENKTYYTDLQHMAEQFARENNLVIEEAGEAASSGQAEAEPSV